MKTQRLSKTRKEQIAMAYVLATKGVLPTNLAKLLHDMREIVGGDVSEDEVRASIKWALRKSRTMAAKAAHALGLPARRRPRPRLRLVK
jgi:hypothetical protein